MDVHGLSAEDLGARLLRGELTAESVAGAYLDRIDSLDRGGPELRAVLQINPQVLDDARALDATFRSSGPVGSLHGVPVLIKGNIEIAGLIASAGSLALAEHVAPADAFLVRKLRQSGALILGSSNLSEWANFRDQRASSGWSSLGGQVRNPYVLDRNPCGSSSGSAVAIAAGLAPLAAGTETHGSIVCPAAVNGVVGIKPTLGLVSRHGIIPISHSQDTAGPMARTVRDAAMLLEALTGPDPADSCSRQAPFTSLLADPVRMDLQDIRIGVLRSYRGCGQRPDVESLFENALVVARDLGAVLIDPVEHTVPDNFFPAAARILKREFRAGINAYLGNRKVPEDRRSLAGLIEWNQRHAEVVMPHFGQSLFLDAEALGGPDGPEYQADINLVQDGLRRDLAALFSTHDVNAIMAPVIGPAWKTDWVNGDSSDFGGTAYLAAISGAPSVTLPAGTVRGLPVAISLTGAPFSEPRLIRIAHALEQAIGGVPAPQFLERIED